MYEITPPPPLENVSSSRNKIINQRRCAEPHQHEVASRLTTDHHHNNTRVWPVRPAADTKNLLGNERDKNFLTFSGAGSAQGCGRVQSAARPARPEQQKAGAEREAPAAAQRKRRHLASPCAPLLSHPRPSRPPEATPRSPPPRIQPFLLAALELPASNTYASQPEGGGVGLTWALAGVDGRAEVGAAVVPDGSRRRGREADGGGPVSGAGEQRQHGPATNGRSESAASEMKFRLMCCSALSFRDRFDLGVGVCDRLRMTPPCGGWRFLPSSKLHERLLRGVAQFVCAFW